MPGAAFVIVGEGDDITEPTIARDYARAKSLDMGRSTLHEAFARVGRGYEKDNKDQNIRCTYKMPDDSVLLMIGNTDELITACKVARSIEPHLIYIETDSNKAMQLRYVRIQVSKIPVIDKGQIDTLIALGAKLPASSEKGWHEPKGRIEGRVACVWPERQVSGIDRGYASPVDLNDLPNGTLEAMPSRNNRLPGRIKAIKEYDGKKWIDV